MRSQKFHRVLDLQSREDLREAEPSDAARVHLMPYTEAGAGFRNNELVHGILPEQRKMLLRILDDTQVNSLRCISEALRNQAGTPDVALLERMAEMSPIKMIAIVRFRIEESLEPKVMTLAEILAACLRYFERERR